MANNEETTNDVPLLVKMSKLMDVYKSMQEEDEEGNAVPLRMHVSKEFKEELNVFFYNTLFECAEHALQKGRKKLQPEDVPSSLQWGE